MCSWPGQDAPGQARLLASRSALAIPGTQYTNSSSARAARATSAYHHETSCARGSAGRGDGTIGGDRIQCRGRRGRKGAGRGIGIHGSKEEDGVWQGIGKAESNGCIRMPNPDVEEVFDFAPIGTVVTIVE